MYVYSISQVDIEGFPLFSRVLSINLPIFLVYLSEYEHDVKFMMENSLVYSYNDYHPPYGIAGYHAYRDALCNSVKKENLTRNGAWARQCKAGTEKNDNNSMNGNSSINGGPVEKFHSLKLGSKTSSYTGTKIDVSKYTKHLISYTKEWKSIISNNLNADNRKEIKANSYTAVHRNLLDYINKADLPSALLQIRKILRK